MITGEAVALDVVPATVASRLLSGIIDYSIYGTGLYLAGITAMVVGIRLGLNDAEGATLMALCALAWFLLIPLAVEYFSKGRSAGRLVTGTRVVRDDGGTVNLRHCLVRVLVGLVEIWIISPALALLVCAVTKRGKRLGDLLAGTYVVRIRHGAARSIPLIMPPELAAWAKESDLRRMPGALSLHVRTFLQRTSSMAPVHRQRLGAELASYMAEYVSPPPPAGTHPERFLAAVMVERRNRELLLELRDRQLEDAVRAESTRIRA
ncbi:RDD family protein [Actinomyces slackii]|uniref:RDD family n=2 Tax=Actinomyces slackii TaxID=52774 RepID=A0A3S4TE36_9ACTO|nr:RDD family [Actinomyces slackii]